MSKRKYIKTLNEELQKLNELIDYKIIHEDDYRREARRHKKLLVQLRKERASRALSALVTQLLPRFF